MTVPASSDARLPTEAAARQTQFLEVITRDEAARRFHHHLTLKPLGSERVSLLAALRRVLAEDIVSAVDVPSFDRSNVDGFAIQAADTRGASEESLRLVRLNPEVLSPGVRPQQLVEQGTATTIATGGMLPRGADAVLMVEHSDVVSTPDGPRLEIRRNIPPGENVTFAGTDMARGETVLRTGQQLTSRELGVLAAVGRDWVNVFLRPRVAILSTGDEIVTPGRPLPKGSVYDSNAAILGAAVEELGGEPVLLGVVPDDETHLESALRGALQFDAVVLSGGTSKGAGDLSYRIVARLGEPGVVAHGVALKPGKPICLAVVDGKPVVILPGFPTSAIFTFHEFVAPVLRVLGGRALQRRNTVQATLPMRVNSQRGRTEYLLVRLLEAAPGGVEGSGTERTSAGAPAAGGQGCRQTSGEDAEKSDAVQQEHPPPGATTWTNASPSPLVAYPMGQGSGSVTTFSYADGFVTIDQHTEILPEGTEVEVALLDREIEPADLTVVTSHCVGLDRLLSRLVASGLRIKSMNVGSTGALAAARRGECDLAGIHLLDPDSGEYNRPFVEAARGELVLAPGYGRMQCLVHRSGDVRFAGQTAEGALRAALEDPGCRMVNRNPGSGTRILLDRLLSTVRQVAGGGPESAPAQPPGYGVQVRSHNAVCAAVADGRADWGVAIEVVARLYDLSTIPLTEERFDFVIPRRRRARPPVQAFVNLLGDASVQADLRRLGFLP